jgi:hypothetical protein
MGCGVPNHIADFGKMWKAAEGQKAAALRDDEVLHFCVGSQVMLTQNEPVGGFVNGDIGKVIGFRHATEEELQKRVDEKKPLEPGEPARRYPIVQFHRTCKNGGNTRLIMPANKGNQLYRVGVALRRNVPLRLAWAITVHKSQGMSLPRLQVELGNPFAAGQCYVALSRAMEIDGLCINQYDRDETKIDYEAKRFHEAVSKGSMVEFEKRSHFWWCDVVNGLRHPAWVDVFKGHGNDGKGGTSFGSEFARWVAKYPVPENRKPLKAQAFTLPTQNGLALLPSSAPPQGAPSVVTESSLGSLALGSLAGVDA